MSATQPNERPPHLWVKGQSGNPAGRPPGSKRREAVIVRWLAPHGGVNAVSPAEYDLLAEAAELHLLNGRRRQKADPVRVAYRIEQIMARCGLLGHPTAGETPDAPPDEPVHSPEAAAKTRTAVMAAVAEAKARSK
jgi:Family of unknown function (DUF5681)